ncbi:hypothetical protein [Methanogenium organophilum]|uniref:Uncharacterized protein n=1 Tax=Methanogenium organophilum TaxID=2199 RepID=A0A9X9T8H5_METOG|nr:hypothetical protein [Methanogenium organophilum]WAI02468.1 hypothetical protein OU421_06230 [Methanogenium organophilum]
MFSGRCGVDKGHTAEEAPPDPPDQDACKDAVQAEEGEKEEPRLHEVAITHMAKKYWWYYENLCCAKDKSLCHIWLAIHFLRQ